MLLLTCYCSAIFGPRLTQTIEPKRPVHMCLRMDMDMDVREMLCQEFCRT